LRGRFLVLVDDERDVRDSMQEAGMPAGTAQANGKSTVLAV
jgi:hypothetical protein